MPISLLLLASLPALAHAETLRPFPSYQPEGAAYSAYTLCVVELLSSTVPPENVDAICVAKAKQAATPAAR